MAIESAEVSRRVAEAHLEIRSEAVSSATGYVDYTDLEALAKVEKRSSRDSLVPLPVKGGRTAAAAGGGGGGGTTATATTATAASSGVGSATEGDNGKIGWSFM